MTTYKQNDSMFSTKSFNKLKRYNTKEGKQLLKANKICVKEDFGIEGCKHEYR